MGLAVTHPRLDQNGYVITNNRIDARGLIASENNAGQHERQQIFALKEGFLLVMSAGGAGCLRRRHVFHFL